MGKSKIEWTERTWSPVAGCTKVDPGCKHCYAERLMETRLRHIYPDGFRLHIWENRIKQPLGWTKDSLVFVCSMGDLFHRDVPDSTIEDIFDVMMETPQHTYQVLTKRPERMARMRLPWTKNIWAGVSVTNQGAVTQGWLDMLKETPAVHRFASFEPLLEPLRLGGVLEGSWLDWAIVGGESGPRGREMPPEAIVGVISAARKAGVPVFVKQMGTHWARRAKTGFRYGKGDSNFVETLERLATVSSVGDRKGSDPRYWPTKMRVREWPPELEKWKK